MTEAHDVEARLEQRVVAALKREGLIRPDGRHPWWRQSAALAVLFALGLGTGWVAATNPFAPKAEGERYLLALYSGPAYRPVVRESVRAAEYGDWARRHSRTKAAVLSGERLGDGATLGPPAEAASLAGYFIVRAPNRDEALRLARSMPHLDHGGTIIVRAVSPPGR